MYISVPEVVEYIHNQDEHLKQICRPLRGLGALLELPPTAGAAGYRYIASFAGSAF